MPLYQSVYNGSKVVQRQVKPKRADDIRTKEIVQQTGGAVIVAKSVPAPSKEQDKKEIRRRMALELSKSL